MRRGRSLSAGSRTFDDIGLFGMTGFSRAPPSASNGFVVLSSEWNWDDSNKPVDEKSVSEVFDSWVSVGKDTVFHFPVVRSNWSQEFEQSNSSCKQFISDRLPILLAKQSFKNTTILELGCANGWFVNWLTRESIPLLGSFEGYVGVDVSPKMIEKAATRYLVEILPETEYRI